MSRKAAAKPAAEQAKPENQPETKPAEDQTVPVGSAPDQVKEQQNDQTSNEPGLANALLSQIEDRKDAELKRDDATGNGVEEPLDVDGDKLPADVAVAAVSHQSITDSVAREAAADAVEVQAAQAENVKNAFVAETRGERLDTFQPQRVENVRVLVESNDHLDRSGDNVKESNANRIVMSDGVDEARMIDVQPEGAVEEEFDLGNGIRQTNLK